MEGIIKYSEDDLKIIRMIKELSDAKTPKFVIKKKGNYDTVRGSFMLDSLKELFPGRWSWVSTHPTQFLGAEWIYSEGELVILWPSGHVQKFLGKAAHRIAYAKDAAHTHDNIIDLGNDVKASNTEALKFAINRLIGIADDVYRQNEVEGWDLSDEDLELCREISDVIGQINQKYQEKFQSMIDERYNNGASFIDTLKLLRDWFDSNMINNQTRQEITNKIAQRINKKD